MLGIHARNVLWDITNCARMDATSESSNQGHSEVKGQIGAILILKVIFYHLCNKIQVNLDFLIQLTKNRYGDYKNTLWYHLKLLWARKSLSK